MNLTRSTAFLQIAGALIFLFLLTLLELTTPGYNWQVNVISDLGVNLQSATTFNTLTIMTGLGLLAISLLYAATLKQKILSLLLALIGVGVIGVGLFPKTNYELHVTFAAIAFIGAILVMLYSCRLAVNLYRAMFALLGMTSLVALIIFAIQFPIGLIENLIVIPFLIWNALFGILISKN